MIAAAIVLLDAGGLVPADVLKAAHAENAVSQAASRKETITFAIENMTCALCLVTVRKAMASVTGVLSVSVDFEAKTATVVFDPAAATAADIAAASANAGYPAKPAG